MKNYLSELITKAMC